MTLKSKNKYLQDDKIVIDAIWSSCKIEGSKTTKKQIAKWYKALALIREDKNKGLA